MQDTLKDTPEPRGPPESGGHPGGNLQDYTEDTWRTLQRTPKWTPQRITWRTSEDLGGHHGCHPDRTPIENTTQEDTL